jgi:hypothetical protein
VRPTLVDAAGTAHAPVAGPVRIVSLVPSITECLCALGLAESLVGRTGFCVHPRDTLRRVPKVGGTKDVDLGRVRALAPTHVVLNIDENTRATADRLAEFVPSLVVTHPLAPEDNFALYALLGGIFGREPEAERLAGRLRAELAALRGSRALPARRVLYLIWRKPWMTVSRDTYISRMLALANWATWPAAAARRYPELELPDARGAVDLALLSSEPYPFRERHAAMVREVLGPATGVHLVEGDMLSWYGSRAIAGVAYLRRLAADLNAPTTTVTGRMQTDGKQP